MIGLKRGTVELLPHDPEWDEIAKKTVAELEDILGSVAVSVQHVGSTSIKTICAKPIIDIAIAVRDFSDILQKLPALETHGYIRRNIGNVGEVFLSCGDDTADTRTHHIHIVLLDSRQWRDYIFFRNYMNSHPDTAAEYERLKRELMEKHKNDRLRYTDGKAEFIENILNLREGREDDKACEIVP